jgi:hypothetical protein
MPPDHSQGAAGDSPATEPETELEPPITEHGGPSGPEPTRFGDWERKGRCVDF